MGLRTALPRTDDDIGRPRHRDCDDRAAGSGVSQPAARTPGGSLAGRICGRRSSSVRAKSYPARSGCSCQGCRHARRGPQSADHRAAQRSRRQAVGRPGDAGGIRRDTGYREPGAAQQSAHGPPDAWRLRRRALARRGGCHCRRPVTGAVAPTQPETGGGRQGYPCRHGPTVPVAAGPQFPERSRHRRRRRRHPDRPRRSARGQCAGPRRPRDSDQ